MSNENKKISFLKKLRESLLESKKDAQIKDEITQFYEDSLKHVTDGMVVIIGDDFMVPPQKAIKGTSHQVVAQEIFDELAINKGIEPINFNDIPGDFGDAIPVKYNYIFIRMASILNGPTIVYYPEVCNEFQIKQLEEFNNKVKAFNESEKKGYKVEFEYNGRNDEQVSSNLDELLEILNSKNKKTVL